MIGTPLGQAVNHWFWGEGEPIYESFSDFDFGWGVNEFRGYTQAKNGYVSGAPQGAVGFEGYKQFNVYGAHGNLDAKLTGTFTSSCDRWSFEGKITIETNTFDFNWGNRPWREEMMVRGMSLFNPVGNDFDFIFVGGRKVSDGGSL